MALPNANIVPGPAPLLWSDVYQAFVQVNQNFDSIAATIGGAGGPPRTVTNVTQANPAVVTTSINHGYLDGQPVTIYSVTGMPEINGTEYYAKRLSDTTFSLYTDNLLTTTLDSTLFGTYISDGIVVGSLGIDPVDFSTLDSDIIPTDDNEYELGSPSNAWKNLYLRETTIGAEDVNNGLWIGSLRIQNIDGAITLPAGSTIDGDLIIDPAKTFFKTINVDGGDVIEATEFGSNVNFDSGTGISLAVDSGAETITITNEGVTQLTAGTAISVSGPTGNVTVTNTGVTSIGNTTSLPAAATGRAAGAGITASATSGGVTFTNTGVISISQGSGITVSSDPATGDVTITNASPAQVTFRTYAVTGTIGQASIVADDLADTFTFNAGYGMIITTDDATDTLTLTVDQNIDITGSVFADDSTLLVDGVDAKIKGTVDTLNVTASSTLSGANTGVISGFVNVSGTGAGSITGFSSATIGTVNANLVGASTGYHTGDMTGSVFADDSTKLVDAVEGLIVGPVEAPSVSVNGTFNFTTTGAFNQLANIEVPDSGSLNINQGTNPVFFNGDGEDQILTIQYGRIRFPDETLQTTAWTGVGDLTGSVFGDDSTKLVDAVEGKIVGDIDVAGTAAFNVSNVPSDSTGASGDKQGMIAFDATSVYFCIADWAAPGTADIWVKQDWGTTGAW